MSKRTRSTTFGIVGLVGLAALVAACVGRPAPSHLPRVTARILGAGSVITEHTGNRVTAPGSTKDG